MLSSMYSAVSGLNASNQRMAVVGDNIANVSTSAYKTSEISFESLINLSVGGVTGQEIGGGVLTGNLRYDWSQGTIQKSSNPYDMAIAGNGFFIVKDDVNTYFTRDGQFGFNAAGNLQTSSGMAIQGFKITTDATTGATTTAATATDIDIVETAGTPPVLYQDVTVDNNGIYYGVSATGVKTPLYQIALCTTTDSSVMAKMSNNLYEKTSNDATDPLIIGAPATNGLGAVESQSLEMSNVDIAREFVNMIEAQRAFSANSKVITTSDEMLQELVNIKR
jgi:flagellar hook protein FlgE